MEVELVSAFLSALTTAHHWSRMSEEADTLCKQLAMILVLGLRSAASSAILEGLPGAGSSLETHKNTAIRLQTIPMQMSSISEHVPG